jgi:hypothetical protein
MPRCGRWKLPSVRADRTSFSLFLVVAFLRGFFFAAFSRRRFSSRLFLRGFFFAAFSRRRFSSRLFLRGSCDLAARAAPRCMRFLSCRPSERDIAQVRFAHVRNVHRSARLSA